MAAPNLLHGDWIFAGNVNVGGGLSFPEASIRNQDIAAGAAIDASKLITHRSIDVELFAPATTVTASTKSLHIFGAAGSLLRVKAFVTTIATGNDRTVSLDLKRSTAGGAFSTVLTGTIGFDDDSTNLTPVAGVITTPDFLADDLLQVTVAVAGVAGNQALGLHLTVDYYQAYV